jgi:hypothetical protein
MKEQIKEKIVELNFYLSKAMLEDNCDEVIILKAEINDLINQYLNVSKNKDNQNGYKM